MAAAVDLRKLASRDKIREAFNIFDQNEDGYIEVEEVKQLLGSKIQVDSESEWNKIVQELDNNNDGKISFEEYYSMINKFLESS